MPMLRFVILSHHFPLPILCLYHHSHFPVPPPKQLVSLMSLCLSCCPCHLSPHHRHTDHHLAITFPICRSKICPCHCINLTQTLASPCHCSSITSTTATVSLSSTAVPLRAKANATAVQQVTTVMIGTNLQFPPSYGLPSIPEIPKNPKDYEQ